MTPLEIATRAHRDADMLCAGTYGRTKKGRFVACSIGCLARDIVGDDGLPMDRDVHEIVATHYGYPVWLAYLQDVIFEGLPDGESVDWHVQIASAIANRSRDWTVILHEVHAAILRVAERSAGDAAPVVAHVRELHEAAARGQAVDSNIWSKAQKAAWSAADSAAWRAARSAACSAAWSAADSAEWNAAGNAAWRAAGSAADSAESNAAGNAAWRAAGSAADSAARCRAYREIRDATLAAITR